jgi:hypothetical protein
MKRTSEREWRRKVRKALRLNAELAAPDFATYRTEVVTIGPQFVPSPSPNAPSGRLSPLHLFPHRPHLRLPSLVLFPWPDGAGRAPSPDGRLPQGIQLLRFRASCPWREGAQSYSRINRAGTASPPMAPPASATPHAGRHSLVLEHQVGAGSLLGLAIPVGSPPSFFSHAAVHFPTFPPQGKLCADVGVDGGAPSSARGKDPPPRHRRSLPARLGEAWPSRPRSWNRSASRRKRAGRWQGMIPAWTLPGQIRSAERTSEGAPGGRPSPWKQSEGQELLLRKEAECANIV